MRTNEMLKNLMELAAYLILYRWSPNISNPSKQVFEMIHRTLTVEIDSVAWTRSETLAAYMDAIEQLKRKELDKLTTQAWETSGVWVCGECDETCWTKHSICEHCGANYAQACCGNPEKNGCSDAHCEFSENCPHTPKDEEWPCPECGAPEYSCGHWPCPECGEVTDLDRCPCGFSHMDEVVSPCDVCNLTGSDTCAVCNGDGKFDNLEPYQKNKHLRECPCNHCYEQRTKGDGDDSCMFADTCPAIAAYCVAEEKFNQ